MDEEATNTELATDSDEAANDAVMETPEDTTEGTEPDKDVRKLRREAATLRERAKAAEARAARTDTLAARLHTELVRASGKLADPTDFPYNPDADLLDDPEALNQAIDALLEAKPHLRSRTPKGDVGQGNRGRADEPVNFHNILKQFI
ncbi:hypothetical protein KXD96_22820 [Mycobacterium sp. SMC-2]|uniref:hypothetical protein n=1 Tax=Mycobacterium sp. SMC-2 TaxID=2857058 RepID=UPI0021B179A7|nr:hypothetical protein [Mycobacterium sp. SMC-2]UXA05710.1 hypothetical protein KXD96_22820 [Mycobacterium sp. SMC-2]